MIDKFAYGRFFDLHEINEYKWVGTYSILIQSIVKLTNCRRYLELGVANGSNIHMIRDHVETCVGVDLSTELVDRDRIDFRQMTTDDFFDINQENFDIIFIDANHNWINVRRDFENSLKILNEFGIIILHDTDPVALFMLHPGYCSDSYHINDYIYSNHPELDMVNLPICDMGLTIVKRKKDKRISKFL